MKTKEEIIAHMKKFMNDRSYPEGIIEEILSELHKLNQIPTLNPMRIEYERFKKIYTRVAPMKAVVEEYNSTLPESKQLEPLPSEMPDELPVMVGGMGHAQSIWDYILQTYGTPKREWWMDLKEGDKFMANGKDWKFHKAITSHKLYFAENMCFDVSLCTPYIEPTTREKLLATMTLEQKELLKQWEAER